MKNTLFKQTLPHVLVLLGFLLLALIKFYPQLEGKQVIQGDIIQYKGMSSEMIKWAEKTGEYPAWSNAMFGGMPTYQTGLPAEGNWVNTLRPLFSLGFERPIGYFLTAMIGGYLLFLVLGLRPILSALGGIAFAFTTYHFLIFEAGHNTKLFALGFSTLVLAGVIRAYKGYKYQGFALASIGLSLQLGANHFQMTYYLGLCIFLLALVFMIQFVKENRLLEFFKISAVLLLAGFIGLGTGASRILPTMEYGKQTMRGEKILVKKDGLDKGLEWEYAMFYSQGWPDFFTLFIPGFAGGSSAEPVDKNSQFAKAINATQAKKGEVKAPLYWGSLPGTAGPIYFGALIMMWALIGLKMGRGFLKWGLFAGIVLTVLVSFGSNMEGFNRWMFENFPQFNKFRAVNSVLAITALLMISLAGIGLQSFFSSSVTKDEKLKGLIRWGGAYTLFVLLLMFLAPSFLSFEGAMDAQYAQMGLATDVLYMDRISLLRSDGWRVFAILLIGIGASYLYLKERLGAPILGLLFIALTIWDLFTVGNRYLRAEDFVTRRIAEAPLNPRAVDEQILKDSDLSFRVWDVSENPFNSSFASLFHQSIGGYHAAKLQRYQDVIDSYLIKNHLPVINMLNTKYIISNNQGKEAVAQVNPGALGNAWFVDSIVWVLEEEQELKELSGFNPSHEAIVHQSFKEMVNWETSERDSNDKIELVQYKPDHLVYEVSTEKGGFVVFSEIWYGPDLGWELWVDGEEQPLLRANYLLRAAQIPPSAQKVELIFSPSILPRSKNISLFFSFVLLLSLAGLAWKEGKGLYSAANES
jgi:hypothetical protein